MGKWTSHSYDKELLKKIKELFEETAANIQKEHPDVAISWEDFATKLDCNDKLTRRFFEFLVKETLAKSATGWGQAQPQPGHTQHTTPVAGSTSGSFHVLTAPLSAMLSGAVTRTNGATITFIPASLVSNFTAQPIQTLQIPASTTATAHHTNNDDS